MCVLTGGGGAGRGGALRRAPSLHVEGAGSHKVLHALHLETQAEPARYRRASSLSSAERRALITNSSAEGEEGWGVVI